MRFFLPGVHVPHRKTTADMPAERMPSPAEVVIPMLMHIGKPAVPVVSVGDEVFVGTLIAKKDGFVSSPIYSSVSGKIKSISEITAANGQKVLAVKIESDGQMTKDPNITAPTVTDTEGLITAICESGTVGLGGAGFPTYVKFSIPEGKSADTLLINGAECEPYITSDTRTMIDKSEDMLRGISVICDLLDIKRVIIGIESNKKAAIESMRAMAAKRSGIEVAVLPSVYPQGGEKVLIYHTLGRVVPAGKLPIDVGCIVSNCTTVAAIGNYINTGMPLVSKCVTVAGGAVKEPKNVIVPIGTAISKVIEFAGGFSESPYTVLLGGPMMGQAVDNLDVVVSKGTNAVLALTEKEVSPKKETACIHCGACANHCPFGLNPAAFMKAYRLGNSEELARLRVDICMECGCCSFVCPAAKPLIETNKLAKVKLRAYLDEKKKLAEASAEAKK